MDSGTSIPPGFSFGKMRGDGDISGFDCGHEDTNEFLRDDALEYQSKNLAVTYVLKKGTKVFGFVSLAMGAAKGDGLSSIVIPGVRIHQYPGLKIGQLGVTKEAQRQKLGEFLVIASVKLASELKERVGCRFVLVDSYLNNVGFYQRYGFRPLFSEVKGRRIVPMYLVL